MMPEYRSLVVLGDDLYADIVTSYLAVQLKPYNITLHRILSLSESNETLIKADHSIHALNQELGLDFTQLMHEGILLPELVSEYHIGDSTVLFESFPHLKDDLPIPSYQIMMRLFKEGIVTDLSAQSPLIALHRAKKFHPQLHRFYRGDLRPYGANLQVSAYSKLLREIALRYSVNFIETKNLDIVLTNGIIDSVGLQEGYALKNSFFIDLSQGQKLMTPHAGMTGNAEQDCWIGNCLSFSWLTDVIARPANSVEWLFKALVRFVDFFPDTNRQKYLAAEYNRLQKKDLNAVKNFLTVYRWLEAGQKQGHLSKAIEHSLGLFVGSCQLSQDEVTDAYPAYWPSMLMAAGIQPERVPRRVAEIPLSYLKNWYVQRQQNIEYLLRHAQ